MENCYPLAAKEGRGLWEDVPQRSTEHLTVVAWNVNALGNKMGFLLRSNADVIMLSETKLLLEEIQRLQRIASSNGWHLLATPAQKTEKGGRSGGTAILAKYGLTELPVEGELQTYKAEGRVTVAALAHPAKKHPVILGCMYGYAGKQEEQRASGRFLRTLMEEIYAFGAHAVIGGDFNLPLECFEEGLMAEGIWADGMQMGMSSPVPPTCHKAAEGTRIDHLLVSRALFAAVERSEVIQDAGSHPHDPIWMRLKIGKVEGLQVKLPAPLSSEQTKKKDREAEARWLTEEAPRWDQLIKISQQKGDAEEAYLTLSRKWEHYLRAVFGPVQGGRGKFACSYQTAQEQPRKPRLEDIWRTLRGKAIALQQLQQHHPQLSQRILQKMRQTMRQCLTMEEAAELEKRIAEPASLVDYADRRWKAVQKQQQAIRRSAWKERMEAKDLRDICAQLRPTRASPLTMLEEKERRMTDPYEIMEAIREAWQPIHEPEEQPAESPQLQEEWLRRLPMQHFEFPELTTEDCVTAIKELKARTAVGPDGWRPTELKLLPPPFAADMCFFFKWLEQEVEEWPTVLRTAWVTPIPKKTRSAADNRPIAVFSAVYRAWAAARGKQLSAWLHQVMPQSQCGFRAGRGVEAEALKLCSKLEMQREEKTLILSVDFSKAYDGVQHHKLLHIADRLGLGANSQKLMQKATLSQFRQWRLCSQFLGRDYRVKQGLAQGCSLSVSSFNIYALPMIKQLEEIDDTATIVAYADDLIVATNSEETLQQMIQTIEEMARQLGLRLNATKCEYAVMGKKAAEAPAEVLIGGTRLFPVSSIDILGVTVNTVHTPFVNEGRRGDDRKKEAKKRFNVLACLDATWEQKARAAAASPLAKLAYGSWAASPKPAEVKAFRHLTAVAVHGQPARGPRAVEVLLAGYGAVHTQDYKWIPFWKALREWKRSLSTNEEAWRVLREKLEGRQPLREGPIATLAAGLLKLRGELEGRCFITQDTRLTLEGSWSLQDQHQWREAIRQHEWEEKGRHARLGKAGPQCFEETAATAHRASRGHPQIHSKWRHHDARQTTSTFTKRHWSM